MALAPLARAQLDTRLGAAGTQPAGPVQPVGEGLAALPGLVRLPVIGELDTGLAASILAGYGFREAVIDDRDRHHRTFADVAASFRPTSWLAIAGRFTGRYDRHTRLGTADSGWVGDPRLIARAGTAVLPTVWLGTQIDVWFPGGQVPSIEPDAITSDARALVAWHSASTPLTLAASAGFRFDRSAASVPEADQLSPSDRMSLGVSDSHAVLLGAGLAFGIGGGQLIADLTWDYLVGSDAPDIGQSPLRVGAGFRHPLGEQLTAQLLVELSLSEANVDAAESLYPIDPLVSAMAGLSYRFGRSRAVTRIDPNIVDKRHDDPPAVETGSVVVAVVDEAGTALVGARVTVTGPNRVERSETTGDDGRARFADMAPGPVTVAVEHDDFDGESRTVEVSAGATGTAEFRLAQTLPPGQLRGVVRSFGGKPLLARLTIAPLDMTISANQDGEFEVDLPPGTYQVTIEADHFATQIREVVVEEQGVTILNVDMHK